MQTKKKVLSIVTAFMMVFLMFNFVTLKAELIENVATVDGITSYPTLALAVENAPSGSVITLNKDITISDTFIRVENKQLMIDLNGHTINVTDNAMYAFFEFKSNLTIMNGSILADGKGNNWGTIATKGGNLVLENLKLSNSRKNGYSVKLQNYTEGPTTATFRKVEIDSYYGGGVEVGALCTANFYDCNFKQSEYYDWCSSNIDVTNGNTMGGDGTANIYSGTYTSDNYSLYMCNSGGRFNIYGGTFKSTGNKAVIQIDEPAIAESGIKKGYLNIYDGFFDGNINISNYNNNTVVFDIKAGVFKNTNMEENVFSNLLSLSSTYNKENYDYTVYPKATGITLSKTEVQLAKGTTTTLTATLAPTGTLDTVTWTSDNESIATVDANGIVTAHGKGTAEITATVGDKSAKCIIRVYEIETPVIPTTPSTGPENGKTEVVLNQEASQVLEDSIKDLIANIDTTTAISEETKASIKSAITDGSTISVEPKVEAVDTTTIDKKVLAKIEEALGTKDKVVQYFELSMNLIVDGREVGTINELTGKVKFTITIDESLIEEGKEFYMIRYHEDGSVEKIEGTLVGNQFTFETDKFSTYALAYETVSGVDTGDTSNPSMLLGLMGLAILLAGKVVYTKKVNQ